MKQQIEKQFTNDYGPFEVKYGLPEIVRFCRKCVISNQRPKKQWQMNLF